VDNRRLLLLLTTALLLLATLTNAISLSYTGASDFLRWQWGVSGPSGSSGPKDLVSKVPRGLGLIRDTVLRATDRALGAFDANEYTPISPGTPSLLKGPPTASSLGYQAVQDDTFIVFYHAPVSVNQARQVLEDLNTAVPRIEAVFGSLPRQKSFSGRKIACFLPYSAEAYEKILDSWGDAQVGSAGMTLVSYDAFAHPFLAGILIRPDTLSEGSFLQVAITHELAHYAFYMEWDVRRKPITASWFSEGLAEFVARDRRRLVEIPPALGLKDSLVLRSPPHPGWRWARDDYWIGYSALLTLQDRWGDGTFQAVLRNSYSMSTDRAFSLAGVPLPVLDRAWRAEIPHWRKFASESN
jgi:hypothetical protein